MYDKPSPNAERQRARSNVTESRLLRYAGTALWFVVVPLAGAVTIVWALSAPGAADAAGPLGAFRAFARDQPLPLAIVAFTLLEMALWGHRHSLPFAGDATSAVARAIPKAERRAWEDAAALLDEAERILGRRARDVEKRVPAEGRESLESALDALRAALRPDGFDAATFRAAFHKADDLVALHLSPFRKSELREYTESIGVAIAVALLLRAFVVEAFKIPSPSMVPTLAVGDQIFVNKSAYGPMVPFTETRLFSRMPPKYGDVIVFQFPEKPEQDFIKRVVALPGDTLEALDGRPIINGWRPPECRVGTYSYSWGEGSFGAREGDLVVEYLGEQAFLAFFDGQSSALEGERPRCDRDRDCEAGLACRSHACGVLQGPFHVKPGEAWVMGDNRNNSHDSRSWWDGKGGGVPFDMIKGRALVVWLSFDARRPGLLSIDFDRIGLSVMGKPKLPADMAKLAPAVDRCFAARPSLAETTPPAAAR